jgi:hypothetical protein
MKISLFTIVFNVIDILPKNMFELNIQNMYEYVDEIIIVEGATKSKGKFDGDTTNFTKNGRSSDGTIDMLKEMEKKYDKVKIIIGDGFWDGKTSMCNAISNIATGDYLWQLDSDEFYKKSDIVKIKKLLEEEKPDSIHFFANHFFGGFDYCIDERSNKWGNNTPWKRIFRHKKGCSYWISHEPPNYVCGDLLCDNGKIINRYKTLEMGIKMFHYSYVIYEQVVFKQKFFRNSSYIPLWNKFKDDKNTLIFGSKVNKFIGKHPKIIEENYGRYINS